MTIGGFSSGSIAVHAPHVLSCISIFLVSKGDGSPSIDSPPCDAGGGWSWQSIHNHQGRKKEEEKNHATPV
jgi:hypothetical protein